MSTGVYPGEHGVYVNGTILRGNAPLTKVEPWLDKTRMVHAPTIYDAACKASLTTAEVDWVAIQKAPTIAKLLGIKFPTSKGKAATALLK